ncbi:putative dNA-directed RNA polymerase subunit beta, partial [Chlamydia psittaci 84-8471/1]
AGSPIVLL